MHQEHILLILCDLKCMRATLSIADKKGSWEIDILQHFATKEESNYFHATFFLMYNMMNTRLEMQLTGWRHTITIHKSTEGQNRKVKLWVWILNVRNQAKSIFFTSLLFSHMSERIQISACPFWKSSIYPHIIYLSRYQAVLAIASTKHCELVEFWE